MRTPRDRYRNDYEYRMLVNQIESFIHTAKYTPSEIREAAILACILYEESVVRPMHMKLTPELAKAFDIMEDFIDKEIR